MNSIVQPSLPAAIPVIRWRNWTIADVTRKGAFGLLWLFVFMIPADEQIAPIPYFVGILAAFAGAAAVLLTGSLRDASRAHYPFFALLLWSGVTYGWTAAPDAAIVRLQTDAQLLILAWLIWQFAPSRSLCIHLIRAYVWGCLLPVADTLYNYASGIQARTETLGMGNVVRYSAGTFNENDLGLLLALSIPFSCYLALTANRMWLRAAYILHTVFTLCAIVLTASRMSFAVAILAIGLMPFVLPGIAPARRAYMLMGLAAAGMIAALAMPENSWQRLSTTYDEATAGSLDGRTQIWDAALSVYRGSPILGVGTASLPISIATKLGKPYVAHNTYLSILVELGIVGAALAILIALVAWRSVCMLPVLERRCWSLALLVWMLGVATLSWEHRKPTWFLFSVLLTMAAAIRNPGAGNSHSWRRAEA